jgi:eukaryotic-like serine/threonine-protein kinase
LEPLQLGRYHLIKRIGQGGFGTVYKATDPMGRTVAVKVLLPGWSDHPETLQRFLLEARTAGELFHPRIATILDMDEADGRRFLVMRYVKGPSLEMVLRANGKLSWSESIQFLDEIAQGLDYAHKHGFVHRDLKPSNILLDPEGAVISDFGLVKAAETSGLSGSDAILGTPAYIAPEVWNGEAVTPATDLYSLACVFYEMLTGERLFQGDSAPQVMKRHIIDGASFPKQWADDVPEGIESVLKRALSQDIRQRYASASEFVSALKALEIESKDAIIETEPIQTKPQATVFDVEKPFNNAIERVEQKPQEPILGGGLDVRQDIIGNLENREGFLSNGFYFLIVVSGLAGILLIIFVLFVALFWTDKAKENDYNIPLSATQIQKYVDYTATAIKLMTSVEKKRSLTATFAVKDTEQAAPIISSTPIQSKTDKFLDDYGVPMVWIPAGSFMMGSEDGDDDEKPIHEVYLDTYAIDVYEVTNELYSICVAEGICQEPGGVYYGEDHPVIYVYGNYAESFCKWRGARLPTEAEWEKAARGGLEGKLYPWGNEEPVCDRGAKNGAQYYSCEGETVAVGSFAPNGYGLYDMAGNVWEWVADRYDSGYYGKSEYENPLGSSRGYDWVLRGGGWYYDPLDLRVASRYSSYPYKGSDRFGFRCAGSP